LAVDPSAADGLYPIDPDGGGPLTTTKLFCDMKAGGWTLVGNYYDSLGDDMPNTIDMAYGGWQQTASGAWDAKVVQIDRVVGGATGSAAVSLAFVHALGQAVAQKNLKICLVNQNGADTVCRSSADGSLTLVSFATGNAKMVALAADKLTYSFARLAGIPGSIDSWVANQWQIGLFCVPRTAGNNGEFGSQDAGLCEMGPQANCFHGVWHGWGYGIAFRPMATADDELVAGSETPGTQCPSVANPSLNSWGFRLYVGP
jgi:hypothetical protein